MPSEAASEPPIPDLTACTFPIREEDFLNCEMAHSVRADPTVKDKSVSC